MARMTRATRKRLGEILVEQGILETDHLMAALQEQRTSGELLGEVLVRLGYSTEDDIAACIVLQFGMPYISIGRYKISDEMLSLFPVRLLKQYQFVPLDRMGRVLLVAAGTLLTPDILSELEQMTGSRIQVFISKVSEVHAMLDSRFVGAEGAAAEAAQPEAGGAAAAAVEQEPEEDSQLSSLGSMLLGD